MDIEVVKNEKEYIEIALKGEEAGIANALVEILLEEKGVEFAAYRLDHPQVGSPVLMVRTAEGSALTAVKQAVKKLKKQAEDFKDALKDAKKPRKEK
jgi:DNA-directed RNA polymerase subunit L